MITRTMRILLILCVLCFSGCLRGPARAGRASVSLSGGKGGPAATASVQQSSDPAQPSKQDLERTTETELQLPAGTEIVQWHNDPDSAGTNAQRIVLKQPTTQKSRTVEKVGTSIGAAQKDTSREVTARLKSLSAAVWIGIGLFLFGIATLTYPPLKAAIGSVTTSVAAMVGGVALVALPNLIVGHEVLIIACAVGGVAVWFLAHRHGQLKALATTSRPGVPAGNQERTHHANQ